MENDSSSKNIRLHAREELNGNHLYDNSKYYIDVDEYHRLQHRMADDAKTKRELQEAAAQKKIVHMKKGWYTKLQVPLSQQRTAKIPFDFSIVPKPPTSNSVQGHRTIKLKENMNKKSNK